jgi:hypothetical protein
MRLVGQRGRVLMNHVARFQFVEVAAWAVVEVPVGIGNPLALEAGRAVDGIGTDSAEVTGRG